MSPAVSLFNMCFPSIQMHRLGRQTAWIGRAAHLIRGFRFEPRRPLVVVSLPDQLTVGRSPADQPSRRRWYPFLLRADRRGKEA